MEYPIELLCYLIKSNFDFLKTNETPIDYNKIRRFILRKNKLFNYQNLYLYINSKDKITKEDYKTKSEKGILEIFIRTTLQQALFSIYNVCEKYIKVYYLETINIFFLITNILYNNTIGDFKDTTFNTKIFNNIADIIKYNEEDSEMIEQYETYLNPIIDNIFDIFTNEKLLKHNIKIDSKGGSKFRMATHSGFENNSIEKVIKTIKLILCK